MSIIVGLKNKLKIWNKKSNPHPITQLYLRPYHLCYGDRGLLWIPSIDHLERDSNYSKQLFTDLMQWLDTVDMDNITHRLILARISFTLEVNDMYAKYTDYVNTEYSRYAYESRYGTYKKVYYIDKETDELDMWKIIQNLVLFNEIHTGEYSQLDKPYPNKKEMLIGAILAYCAALEWEAIKLKMSLDFSIYEKVLGSHISSDFTTRTWDCFIDTIIARIDTLSIKVYDIQNR